MIQLSVPVLAHSTSVCPTSPNHYTHTSVLCISTQSVTNSSNHNFSTQDKKLLSSIYSDVLRATQQIQSTFPNDPSRALALLAEVNSQLSLVIQ